MRTNLFLQRARYYQEVQAKILEKKKIAEREQILAVKALMTLSASRRKNNFLEGKNG